MRNFRELNVWKKAHTNAIGVYSATKPFPKEELYGLVSQMRRSASSVPTNIAEGCGRDTNPQFEYFLNIASGSASELEYQLILSKDLGYLPSIQFNELLAANEEVKKMLTGLIKSLSKEKK